jgi:hypothetical protein
MSNSYSVMSNMTAAYINMALSYEQIRFTAVQAVDTMQTRCSSGRCCDAHHKKTLARVNLGFNNDDRMHQQQILCRMNLSNYIV